MLGQLPLLPPHLYLPYLPTPEFTLLLGKENRINFVVPRREVRDLLTFTFRLYHAMGMEV